MLQKEQWCNETAKYIGDKNVLIAKRAVYKLLKPAICLLVLKYSSMS